MIKARRFACLLAGMLTIFFLNTTVVSAGGSSGIEIGLDSARALGKGNAVVADPGDASTLAYNPAGLTKLDENQIVMGTTIIVPLSEYDSATGVGEEVSTMPAYIPSFFMSLNTPVEKFKVGIGVNAPFGLATQYSSTGNFKYTGISNEIKSIYYTAGGAYEVAPWLSIGGGFSYVEADVRQVSKLNSTLINGPFGPVPDANMELDVDGSGQGWNVGILLSPGERWSIGFLYRSRVRAELRGEMDVDNIQGVIPPILFGGDSFTTSVDTDITFPDSAVIGVFYKINEQWNIEVDFGWTGWGVFDHFDFTYGTPNVVLSANDPSEHKFEDTFSLNVGVTYKVNQNWDVMTGYAFFEQAALENDYNNVFPDGDRHNIAVGLQYHQGPFSVAVGYAAQFVSEVSVDNTVGNISNASVDGDYSGFYHVFVTSIVYRFG